MKICTRCFYPENHPLYLTFDDEGVCSGCRVHEEKDVIDWGSKFQELLSLTSQYKSKNGKNYDCIVPVSGARDSFFILHTVKHKLGLNPLIVTYNKQYNTDLGIRNLTRLRMKLNSDIFSLNVSPAKLKTVTRASLSLRGSMYWHCLAGQTVFPVQIAVKLKIPLIIWGAHQGVDQVGMFSHHHKVEMTRKYRKDHDLMGLEAEDLINPLHGITEKDVFQFYYPDDADIQNVGVRGIYLNNYMRWDTKAQHEEMLKIYDYETDFQTRTFDKYNDVDCFNYSDVHDYIKFIKHGYSKVHDHVAREIRLHRLSREEGRKLIAEYVPKRPVNLDKFLNWIGMTENSFNFILDRHRSPKVWRRNDDFRWEMIHPELLYTDEKGRSNFSDQFVLTQNKRPEYRDDKYIIVGKGYPAYEKENHL